MSMCESSWRSPTTARALSLCNQKHETKKKEMIFFFSPLQFESCDLGEHKNVDVRGQREQPARQRAQHRALPGPAVGVTSYDFEG